jgi:glutamyl-tRNA reductase
VARYRSRLSGLSDSQRAEVEALTRSLLAKVLHEPTVQLKDAAGSVQGEHLAEAVRVLFNL